MKREPQISHYSLKYHSLGKEGADKVLELYVKRSLSLNEGTQKMNCKFEPSAVPLVQPHHKKTKKLIRSVSDCRGFTRNRINRENLTTFNLFTDTPPHECAPQSTKDSFGFPQNRSSREKESKSSKSGTKTPSVFKFFVNLLWKKKDADKKPNLTVSTPVKPPTSITLTENAVPEDYAPRPDSSETKRKNNIKRVFSLKKNLPEEDRATSPQTQTSTKCKHKKPTSLPLQNICRPKSRHCDGMPSTDYYEQVSQEIEQIVKQCEPTNEALDRNKTLHDTNAQKTTDEDSVDMLIQKIVGILKVEGDHVNKKINEDETLHKFFQEISYNSFKNLADAYVEHEVKAKVTEVSPEVKKFAFTLDFTAKVAGICSHTLNRIMGFGHQYVQDTFSEFLQSDQDYMNNTASPD